jgi:two-component system response regulator FixJ
VTRVAAAPSPEIQMSTPSVNVLVVDDDIAVCRILHRMLSDEQYQVKTSQSVVDALAAIEQKPFDAYVMDYKLPDGTGLDVAERIRAKGSEAPIILISGYDPSRSVESREASYLRYRREALLADDDLQRHEKGYRIIGRRRKPQEIGQSDLRRTAGCGRKRESFLESGDSWSNSLSPAPFVRRHLFNRSCALGEDKKYTTYWTSLTDNFSPHMKSGNLRFEIIRRLHLPTGR